MVQKVFFFEFPVYGAVYNSDRMKTVYGKVICIQQIIHPWKSEILKELHSEERTQGK